MSNLTTHCLYLNRYLIYYIKKKNHKYCQYSDCKTLLLIFHILCSNSWHVFSWSCLSLNHHAYVYYKLYTYLKSATRLNWPVLNPFRDTTFPIHRVFHPSTMFKGCKNILIRTFFTRRRPRGENRQMWLTSRINYQTVGTLDRGAVGATDTGLIVIGCQTISSAQTLRINNADFG